MFAISLVDVAVRRCINGTTSLDRRNQRGQRHTMTTLLHASQDAQQARFEERLDVTENALRAARKRCIKKLGLEMRVPLRASLERDVLNR